jgi:hypothetical protein
MKLRWAAILLLLGGSLAIAQHNTEPLKIGSTAPRDSWQGTVKSLDNASSTITLEYEHKGKIESFTGVFKPPMEIIDKNGNPAKPPVHIQVGDKLLVHYYRQGAKYSSVVGGKRHDELAEANLIVRIRFMSDKPQSSGY